MNLFPWGILVMIRKIIKASYKYFIADVLVWLVSHNLPLLIGYYIKDYFDKSSLLLVIGIAFLILLRVIFIRVGARVDIRAQQKWSESFYLIAYDSIKNGTVDLNADNGQLLNSLNEDVNTIISTISYAIDTFCNIIYGIIAVCILLSIHIPLTICILCLPLLAVAINAFAKKRIANFSEKVKEASNNFSTNLNILLKDSRIIRVNNMEKQIYKKIEEDVLKQKQIGFCYSSWRGILNSVTNMITECNILVILFVYMMSGNLTSGSIILFITYSFDLAAMSQYISSLTISIQSMKVYLKSYKDKFLTNVQKEKIKSNYSEVFTKIKKGKVNVLIGDNGTGKSVCLHYLFESEPNSVLLPEKYHLLDTTVKENIGLSVHNEKAELYAKLACVDLDLNHLCKNNISGGQELRIVLARTLCFCKDFILIDNNFTSVDEITRKIIFQNLIELNKTIVFTDHMDRKIYKSMNHIYI